MAQKAEINSKLNLKPYDYLVYKKHLHYTLYHANAAEPVDSVWLSQNTQNINFEGSFN